MKRPPLPPLALVLAALAVTPAGAAPTTVELTADASRSAPNDLARATVFAEASGATPGELAKRVNGLVADGLKTAKTYGSVKTQSGGTATYPIYGKGGKIESWRMRSELALESGDTAALSELLGRLQATLGVSGIAMMPAPETRKKAENEALTDAIAAFRSRAKLVADALGKPYRIKQLSVGGNGRQPIAPMLRGTAMAMADSAPLPMEAGDSQVTVNISGQIELAD